MRQQNVQISYELFLALIRYHLLETAEEEKKIKKDLEKKLDAMVRRELYGKYKTAGTKEEQERFRLAYLEKKGIPEDFQWRE